MDTNQKKQALKAHHLVVSSAKVKGITWQIIPPYLHKPNQDKTRKDIEIKIDDDVNKAYDYIAKYSRMNVNEVINIFKES